MEPRYNERQGSSKIISLYRGIVISKLSMQQYGRKIAENIRRYHRELLTGKEEKAKEDKVKSG